MRKLDCPSTVFPMCTQFERKAIPYNWYIYAKMSQTWSMLRNMSSRFSIVEDAENRITYLNLIYYWLKNILFIIFIPVANNWMPFLTDILLFFCTILVCDKRGKVRFIFYNVSLMSKGNRMPPMCLWTFVEMLHNSLLFEHKP